MEYDPEQLDLLMKKVASTLGSRLEGLLKQQQNILDNQLNGSYFLETCFFLEGYKFVGRMLNSVSLATVSLDRVRVVRGGRL